jgi:hypothetical protein
LAKQNGNRLPVVKCECGAEILLVPDLSEMSKCIEAHALVHGKKLANPDEAEAEIARIQDLLARQVLRLASESADP